MPDRHRTAVLFPFSFLGLPGIDCFSEREMYGRSSVYTKMLKQSIMYNTSTKRKRPQRPINRIGIFDRQAATDMIGKINDGLQKAIGDESVVNFKKNKLGTSFIIVSNGNEICITLKKGLTV